MIHAIATAGWCLLCIFAGLPWPCLFWAPAFYVGRELSQAELRYIDVHGGHRNNAVPWWCGLLPQSWTAKGLLDFLLPLATALAAWAGQAVLWRG